MPFFSCYAAINFLKICSWNETFPKALGRKDASESQIPAGFFSFAFARGLLPK